MPYSAVIFDLIGTLVGFSADALDRVFEQMATALDIPLLEYQHACAAVRLDWEAGAFASVEAHAEHVCRALGRQPAADRLAALRESYLAFTRTALTPRPDALPTLNGLRAAGYRVGMITNCSSEVPLLWSTTQLAPLVDAAVFSCIAGMRKPERRIYSLACAQLGVGPAACVYVGDGGSRELSGATEAGMLAVQLRTPGESATDAARLGREAWSGARIESLDQVFRFLD